MKFQIKFVNVLKITNHKKKELILPLIKYYSV